MSLLFWSHINILCLWTYLFNRRRNGHQISGFNCHKRLSQLSWGWIATGLIVQGLIVCGSIVQGLIVAEPRYRHHVQLSWWPGLPETGGLTWVIATKSLSCDPGHRWLPLKPLLATAVSYILMHFLWSGRGVVGVCDPGYCRRNFGCWPGFLSPEPDVLHTYIYHPPPIWISVRKTGVPTWKWLFSALPAPLHFIYVHI